MVIYQHFIVNNSIVGSSQNVNKSGWFKIKINSRSKQLQLIPPVTFTSNASVIVTPQWTSTVKIIQVFISICSIRKHVIKIFNEDTVVGHEVIEVNELWIVFDMERSYTIWRRRLCWIRLYFPYLMQFVCLTRWLSMTVYERVVSWDGPWQWWKRQWCDMNDADLSGRPTETTQSSALEPPFDSTRRRQEILHQ